MNAPQHHSLGGVPSHQRPKQSKSDDAVDPRWVEDFAGLYDRHYESLVNVAQRVVLERSLAEDCAQDALLAYFVKRPEHAPDRTAAYLRSMARNAAISMVRVESRYVGEEEFESTVAPSAEAEALPSLVAEDLGRGLRELSTRQREVVACRLAGLSVGDTAVVLDISAGSVKTHRHRAARSFASSDEWLAAA